MRLPRGYAEFFKSQLATLRPNGAVYVFGSRADDSRKGGDVDILILSEPKLNWEETSSIRRRFWQSFGFQKIDIVSFSPGETSAFKDLVLLDAIQL